MLKVIFYLTQNSLKMFFYCNLLWSYNIRYYTLKLTLVKKPIGITHSKLIQSTSFIKPLRSKQIWYYLYPITIILWPCLIVFDKYTRPNIKMVLCNIKWSFILIHGGNKVHSLKIMEHIVQACVNLVSVCLLSTSSEFWRFYPPKVVAQTYINSTRLIGVDKDNLYTEKHI